MDACPLTGAEVGRPCPCREHRSVGCEVERQQRELRHYLELTEKVCGTARRRVLLGETIPNEEKIFSIFEPHTELIKRGKQPDPIQYGHKILVIEDKPPASSVHYQVVANGVLDQDVVIAAMTELQKHMGKQDRAGLI